MQVVTFNCPNCETEIRLPEDQRYTTCPNCQQRLDVKALLAYLRGLDAFDEGQEIMLVLQAGPRRLRIFQQPEAKEIEAMELFREAYSSLQVAFEGDLVKDQCQLGIEMMTSMAQEFFRRSMVSAYEGQYWRAAMEELTSQNEYDLLQEKLRRTHVTFVNYLVVWYRQRRMRQLLSVLRKLNRKLALIEEQMEFVEVPRARNRKWTP